VNLRIVPGSFRPVFNNMGTISELYRCASVELLGLVINLVVSSCRRDIAREDYGRFCVVPAVVPIRVWRCQCQRCRERFSKAVLVRLYLCWLRRGVYLDKVGTSSCRVVEALDDHLDVCKRIDLSRHLECDVLALSHFWCFHNTHSVDRYPPGLD